LGVWGMSKNQRKTPANKYINRGLLWWALRDLNPGPMDYEYIGRPSTK